MVIRDSDAADDSAAFYGATAIINGALDCNAWILDNHGALGDGVIDANDECTLIGYDGTPDGITISVVAGEFTEAGGSPIAEGYVLPTVFNSGEPDNPSVLDSELGWSTIDGRVDSNRSETIDPMTARSTSSAAPTSWDPTPDVGSPRPSPPPPMDSSISTATNSSPLPTHAIGVSSGAASSTDSSTMGS